LSHIPMQGKEDKGRLGLEITGWGGQLWTKIVFFKVEVLMSY
jgi:hypothetical protein